VFQAGSHHPLEISVVEIVGLDGTDVFVRQVDARNSFIVG
jgi:hypothetical protein